MCASKMGGAIVVDTILLPVGALGAVGEEVFVRRGIDTDPSLLLLHMFSLAVSPELVFSFESSGAFLALRSSTLLPFVLRLWDGDPGGRL